MVRFFVELVASDGADRNQFVGHREPACGHALGEPGVAVIDAVAHRRLPNETADAVLCADDIHSGELEERAPDGEAVDPVGLSEVVLRREPVSRGELAPLDTVVDVASHLAIPSDSRMAADPMRGRSELFGALLVH